MSLLKNGVSGSLGFARQRSRSKHPPKKKDTAEDTCGPDQQLALIAFELNVRPQLPIEHAKHFWHGRSGIRLRLATGHNHFADLRSSFMVPAIRYR